MSDTCRLFPPFGDPWPSCLLPSQLLIIRWSAPSPSYSQRVRWLTWAWTQVCQPHLGVMETSKRQDSAQNTALNTLDEQSTGWKGSWAPAATEATAMWEQDFHGSCKRSPGESLHRDFEDYIMRQYYQRLLFAAVLSRIKKSQPSVLANVHTLSLPVLQLLLISISRSVSACTHMDYFLKHWPALLPYFKHT